MATLINRVGPWRLGLWAAMGAVLLAPLVAMRFTGEVVWTPFDFAVAATLLFGAAALYEVIAWKARRPAHRLAVGAALALGVALVWAQGAVGIF